MARRKGQTPEGDIMEFAIRLGLTPEDTADFWAMRKALRHQLEGLPGYRERYTYGFSEKQAEAVWKGTRMVNVSLAEQGIRPFHQIFQGERVTRYAIKGMPGSFGQARALSIFEQRAGTSLF